MILHLLRCQGFGVAYYSLTLGRLGSIAPSAFATLGSIIGPPQGWQGELENPPNG